VGSLIVLLGRRAHAVVPKLLGDGNYVGLSSKAPHVNAGKAFIDYFLDDECMNLMSKLGEFVNRKGIIPPLEGVDKIQFVEMLELDKEGYAEKAKEYDKLFIR